MDMTPTPPGVRRGGQRPLVAYLPRALWGCPIATAGSLLFARVLSEWLQVSPFDAAIGWCVSALMVSGVWYSSEPFVQHLWGGRLPTERQAVRLRAVMAQTSAAADAPESIFLIEEEARVGIRTGLRTITVTRRALEKLNDQELAKLLRHGLAHVAGKSATP
jgi:Zn-dependent protease with chaperone function